MTGSGLYGILVGQAHLESSKNIQSVIQNYENYWKPLHCTESRECDLGSFVKLKTIQKYAVIFLVF